MEYNKVTIGVITKIGESGKPVDGGHLSQQMGLPLEIIVQGLRLLSRDKLIDPITGRGWVLNRKGEEFLDSMARRRNQTFPVYRHIELCIGGDRWIKSRF